MIVTLRQPEYLPDLAFFDSLFKSDICIFLDIIRLSRRNKVAKARIVHNGNAEFLTIPVKTSRKHGQMIRDVTPVDTVFWQKKQVKQIYHAYRNAPYFEESYYEIKACIEQEWNSLADLNCALITMLSSLLQISCTFYRASELCESITGDTQVIEITKAVRGTSILVEEGGELKLCDDRYLKSGISLLNYKYGCPAERVRTYKYVPSISVIDPLFTCGLFGTYALFKTVDIYRSSQPDLSDNSPELPRKPLREHDAGRK
jgi:hypothetical protein